MNDDKQTTAGTAEPSRRRFLGTAGITTAGAAVAPLLLGAAAQNAANAPDAEVVKAVDKGADLATDTSPGSKPRAAAMA